MKQGLRMHGKGSVCLKQPVQELHAHNLHSSHPVVTGLSDVTV